MLLKYVSVVRIFFSLSIYILNVYPIYSLFLYRFKNKVFFRICFKLNWKKKEFFLVVKILMAYIETQT